ncbi:MAG: spore germination protein [Lachnospiraceae bacterium]|jgi:spore germination protein KA|nr:spore germination protein [Lachnospiraceae bacterium]
MFNLKTFLDSNLGKLFVYKKNKDYEFSLPIACDFEEDSIVNNNVPYELELDPSFKKVGTKLSDNLDYIKAKYHILINSDIQIKEFNILLEDKSYSAFIIYIDGMVNSEIINDFILRPLMLRNKTNTHDRKKDKESKLSSFSLEDYIINCLIPQNRILKKEEFNDIILEVNGGNCALFIDTLGVAFTAEVKGFKQRSISTPSNEVVVRGSQEAFVESIRTNTSILRRVINNEDLIIENSYVGKFSHTAVSICYLKNITNNDLVAEVQYRINNLDIDYLISSGQLEQLIQDNSHSIFPQIVATERVDKTASHLLEGRVVVLVNGTPYALVMPGVFNDFLSSSEDLNLKSQYSNLIRIIRILSAFLSVLLPGIYVAVTSYHHELIPTQLLFAIAATRESVPFPIIIETLIMETAFELIREGGLRVPSPIGPTIGIVGALILGEAAVSANIVSPILIIIVAITALCSFTIPDLSLNFTFRILRFVYIFLGFTAGFLGLALGLFAQLVWLCNLTSFGSPYLTPYLSKATLRTTSSLFVAPAWKRENKPTFLNSKKADSQGKISMRWKYPKSH